MKVFAIALIIIGVLSISVGLLMVADIGAYVMIFGGASLLLIGMWYISKLKQA